KRGRDIVLKTKAQVDVPKDVFDRGALVRPEGLKDAITNLLASCKPRIPTQYVHACLPETHTFIKMLEFGNVDARQLGALVREELPRHVPLDIEDSYVDWKIIPQDNPEAVRVLAGAIPKKTSDEYTAALRLAGLVPLSLQVEAQAMLRSLVDSNLEHTGPIAIVDLGATRSSFVLYDQGSIQFTVSIPVAGDAATAEIADKLSLSQQEAENAKRVIGLNPAKGGGAVYRALLPMANDLCGAIYRNRVFYGEHFAHARPVTNIMLCGGGSLLPGLAETLAVMMKDTVVTHADPWLRVRENEKDELTLSYATAIGLALTNLV
ncbi:MAG: pilus assembly protein PilM, partial [Patescibacteria group bacterium]|nr:pilus assembly protein PilM [Patescibacteria group bacterium]